MTRFSVRPTHSRVAQAFWVERRWRIPWVGKRKGFCRGIRLSCGASGVWRRAAAGGFLGEQDAEHLGGLPTLRPGCGEHVAGSLAEVGQPHPADEGVELGRERWGRRAGLPVFHSRLKPTASRRRTATCSSPLRRRSGPRRPKTSRDPGRCRRRRERRPRGLVDGHRPASLVSSRAQAEVPGWTEYAQSAITTSPGARSSANWSTIGKSPSANRPAIATNSRAASTLPVPTAAPARPREPSRTGSGLRRRRRPRRAAAPARRRR
jgi:hypothetical protein